MEDKNSIIHLPELLKRKQLNYANYTKESYNIVTLKNHNDYYQSYQKQIPAYSWEKPDWSKKILQKKIRRVNRYNHIIHRNIRNAKNGKVALKTLLQHHNKTEETEKAKRRLTIESLPLIKNRNRMSEISRSFCIPKWRQEPVKKEYTPKKLIKKAMQLGKYVQTIKSEKDKQLVRAYGKQLIQRLKEDPLAESIKEKLNSDVKEPSDNERK